MATKNENTMNDLTETFGPVISSYTREQALEDGVLVDLTEWASSDKGFHGGFTCPVAVTTELWDAIEAIPASLEGIADVRGRAHDVLWMASLAVRTMIKRDVQDGCFKVILPSRGTRKRNRVLRVAFSSSEGFTLGFPENF
jgi:hypothetical protein